MANRIHKFRPNIITCIGMSIGTDAFSLGHLIAQWWCIDVAWWRVCTVIWCSPTV